MSDLVNRASRSLRRRWSHARRNAHLRRLNRDVAAYAEAPPWTGRAQPVVFFNASTRLEGLSLNAAYSLIASWAVRLAGVPVVNFVCHSGMTRCVLGTNRDDLSAPPPCADCIEQSRAVYAHSSAAHF